MEHAMKFQISGRKLKMEIGIDDLVYLFESDSGSIGDDGNELRIKPEKEHKERFAERVVRFLLDEASESDGCLPNWAVPFDRAIGDIQEGYEEFIDYGEVVV